MQAIPFPTMPLENAERSAVPADKVISGTPEAAHKILYSSPSGEFHAGIYESSIGKWKVSYTEDEFCTLLEGEVILTNAKGEARDFQAPQSFLIPAGFEGTWESVTNVRKYFVIYEKAA